MVTKNEILLGPAYVLTVFPNRPYLSDMDLPLLGLAGAGITHTQAICWSGGDTPAFLFVQAGPPVPKGHRSLTRAQGLET